MNKAKKGLNPSAIYLPIVRFLKGHQNFAVILLVMLILVAAIARITLITNSSAPGEEAVEEKPVTFSNEAVESVESLKDNNVTDPGTQNTDGRNNPFSE